MIKHHVVFIGDSAVGKTTLIHRLKTGVFDPYVRTTVGCDFSSYVYQYRDQEHMIMMWDTCGRSSYMSFVLPYLHKADLIVILYDTCKPSSVGMWLSYAPDKSKVLIVPTIHEESDYVLPTELKCPVSAAINIKTGDNIQSLLADVKRMLSGDPGDRRTDHCCITGC